MIKRALFELAWLRERLSSIVRFDNNGSRKRTIDYEIKEFSYIIFSRDRPAQLDLLLTSLAMNFDIIPKIIIIVSIKDDTYKVGYEKTFERHVNIICDVIEESLDRPFRDCFEIGFSLCVGSTFVGFLVDDAIFIRPIKVSTLFNLSSERLVFCPRLGLNINYNYVTKLRQPIPRVRFISPIVDSTLITWEFQHGIGDWRLPFALDGNIFRRDVVEHLLTQIEFDSPNSLECGFQNFNYRRKTFFPVAYAHSRMIVLPLNRVQEVFTNPSMSFSADFLNERFIKGAQLSMEQFQRLSPNSSTYDYIPNELR